MSKYESSIKTVPYPQEAVYRNISDLSNLARIRDRVPNDKIQEFTFDQDSVSVSVPPVGQITLRIVEREEPKCIKFEAVQSPLPFKLWVQILPIDELTSKMKVTVDADIPMMLKPMVNGPLQDGVEKVADALALIDYRD
jgi:uncharacterized protein YqkB